jgi:hypothetical protein
MQWVSHLRRETKERGLGIAVVIFGSWIVRDMLHHYVMGRLNELVARYSGSWLGQLSSAATYLLGKPLVFALVVFIMLISVLILHAYMETRRPTASTTVGGSVPPSTSDSNVIQVKATRIEWWDSNIQTVIRDSERLVIIDSVMGHKHVFWNTLSKRIGDDPKPFHFVYLMLKDGDPFLERCLKRVGVPTSMTQVVRA